MAMGIVSDSDFDKELGNLTKKTPSVIPPALVPEVVAEILPAEHPGRKEGDNNVPDSLRKVIGETAQLEGRQAALQLAAKFGISPSSVSAYANGSHSTASMNDQPNLDFLNSSKQRVAKKAIKKVISAIDNLTEEKMSEAKPAELAAIARHLSAVVKDMEPEKPKDPTGGKEGPTFVFFAPTVREEKHYETITVRE